MAAFAPTDLSGLWAWWDANVGVTGGTSVTAWADQSGNGRALTATSGQEPATVTAALNGLDAISSYGKLAKMSTAVNLPNLSAGGTVFLVAKQSLNNGATNFDAGGVFIGAGNMSNMQIQRGNTSTAGQVSIRAAINSTAWVQSLDVVAEDTWKTIRLVNNGTNNYISISNGTEEMAAASGGSYTATPVQIFKTLGGAQGNKQIAMALIYTRELTPTEIGQVEGYLQTKFAHY